MTKNILIAILTTGVVILSLIYNGQRSELEEQTLLGEKALSQASVAAKKAEAEKHRAVRAAAIVLAAQRKTEEAQSKLEACKSLKK